MTVAGDRGLMGAMNILFSLIIGFSAWSSTRMDFFANHTDKKIQSTFWSPLGSSILPGLGQYLNGQTRQGLLYSGLGLAGVALMSSGYSDGDFDSNGDFVGDLDDAAAKRVIFGAKTLQFAGQLSLYHDFRTTVNQLQDEGSYLFLEHDETVDQLLLAPFEFDYLTKWTTAFPLGVAAGVLGLVAISDRFKSPNLGNLIFTSGLSYEAGVGEEMMFRGWMQPLLYENWRNFWATNAIQAAIFGAAHISETNRTPVFQTLSGLYFGWMVHRNDWSLREAVFLHTWWNVLIFAASQSIEDEEANLQLPLYLSTF